MNCLQSVAGSSGRATQCASGSTTDSLDDEDDFGGHCSRPPRIIGAPFIMDAAFKVDKCLARLQSLQGTVAVPKVHLSSSASANTLSPIFSRSRSCLHGSPKVHENEKIRIHDVLRWSDDFSGKYKQERREKYLRRLSRTQTQVFDDKKDPLDPHGEWKHWSSPAGDVHKVISEILMASQIAKQITSMVNAAIVQSDSSDEGKGKRNRRRTEDTAASPNPMKNAVVQQKARKGDPLHKFRVVVAADGPAKKRSNSINRKEVLYPKSKQPIPDRSNRSANENEVTPSTAKKMQSRRSPRGAAKDTRPQEDMWSAKDVTNSKSKIPQADVRAAKDTASSKSHQLHRDTWTAKDVTNSKSHQFQANVGAGKVITTSKSNQSQVRVGAAKGNTNSKSNQSQTDTRVANGKFPEPFAETTAAKQITNSNSKSHKPQAGTWAAKEITNSKPNHAQKESVAAKNVLNSKSQRRPAPWPESKKLVPRTEKQEPYTLRRVQSSKFPPRTLVEKPKLSTTPGKSAKHSFLVKQGSRGPNHLRTEPGVVGTFSTATTTRAEASPSEIKTHRQISDGSLVLPSTTKELAAFKGLLSATASSLSSATAEIKRCNSSPPVGLPLIFSSRPKASKDFDELATSAASPGFKTRFSSQDDFIDPALDGFNVVRSTVPESRTCSGASSPQLKTPPVKGSQQQHVRSNPLIGSLRHKFVMEATEVKSRNNSWRLNQPKSSKAVLFSNPAFAPASPGGARPASEERQRPVAETPPKSPARSISATRRVFERIGRAISAGRRSISPEITRRLNSTRQRLTYFSPGKSLPSLISRLPSRGKRKPSPVTRPSIVKSTSCSRPAPASGELPLPPGRKSQHHFAAAAAQQKVKIPDPKDQRAASPSTDSSSYFSLRMLKDLNVNAQIGASKGGFKGTTPDIAPRTGNTRNNDKGMKGHSSLNWENEAGAVGVLSSCQKWVEESAPPPPGGVCKHEKENAEPLTQRILINENVVATGWDDQAVAPSVLSTSRSRKTDILSVAGGGSCTTPAELKSSFSGVRRSHSTGRIRSGTSLLKRARDWIRTQTPNRMRTQAPSFDQPRQSGLVI